MEKMINLIYGFVLGTLLSMFSISFILDKYMGRNEEQQHLIGELMKENVAYRKVINKIQDDANKTYWG